LNDDEKSPGTEGLTEVAEPETVPRVFEVAPSSSIRWVKLPWSVIMFTLEIE
jgi:hypothetical protein